MLSSSYCFAGWGRVLCWCTSLFWALWGACGRWDTGELLEGSDPVSVCKVMGYKCWGKKDRSATCLVMDIFIGIKSLTLIPIFWHLVIQKHLDLQSRGEEDNISLLFQQLPIRKKKGWWGMSLSLWTFLQPQKLDVALIKIMVAQTLCQFMPVLIPE